MKSYLKLSLLFGFVFFFNQLTFAAPKAPDDNIAGTLQKELELQLKKTEPEIQPKVLKPEEKKKGETTAEVAEIKGFKFTGNKLLTEEELQKVVSKWKEKKLTFNDLEEITKDIQNYYVSKNYLAKAILPPQEIKNGVVKISITEGVLGEILIKPLEKNSRISSEVLKKYFSNNGQKENVNYINTEEINRKILLLNQLPGVQATGAFEAGAKDGESNFNVSLFDTPFFTGQVSATNYGSAATGFNQVNGYSNFNNISGIGDIVNLNAIKTTGSEYFQGGYTRPIGYDGLKAGVTASHLKYKTLFHFSQDNQTQGTAQTAAANLSYPINLTNNSGTNIKLTIESKDYKNLVTKDEVIQSDYIVENIISSINGYFYDNDGSSILYDLSYYFGELKIKDKNQLISDSAVDSNGRFKKYTYNFTYNQPLKDFKNYNWLISVNGQLANKNLNSAEQLSFGGPFGVQSYPTGQGAGSEGIIIKTALPYSYNKYAKFGPFIEKGFVEQYVNVFNNFRGNTGASNNYKLSTIGLEYNLAYDNLTIDGSLAYRLGNLNPLLDANGNRLNVDHQNCRSQLWLRAAYSF